MANFPTGAQSFTLSLAEFAKAAPEQARTVVRKVSQEMLAKVVLRTPVGNRELWAANIERKKKGLPLYPPGYVGGRLRANWNVGIGTIDTNTSAPPDKSGQAAIAAGTAKIATASGEMDIFITNALPYAIPVEYGHSKKQAPAGMVRITVTEFQTYVDAAARSAQ